MGSLGSVQQETLVGREAELAELEETLTAVSHGGRGVLLEGPAGIGKSSLIAGLVQRARAAGLPVAQARGGELEQGLGLGVARVLVESVLRRPAESGGDEYDTFERLFWSLATAAEDGGLVVVVDDIHWADPASLRFLLYLARRIEPSPVLLVLGRRTDEPDPDGLLRRLAAEPQVARRRLAPLAREAVGALAARTLGSVPEPPVLDALVDVAGGNPFFTEQLTASAKDDAVFAATRDPARLRELAPSGVVDLVATRLRRLSPAGRAYAQALAVLGIEASHQHCLTLAGLDAAAGAAALDELEAADMVAEGPATEVRFTHPLVRSGIHGTRSRQERQTAHDVAARLLHEAGATPRSVAAHLLETPPQAREWARDALTAAAATEALPEVRVAYLRRAVAEQPTPPPPLLTDLALAEAAVHDPEAPARLRAALRVTADPAARVGLEAQLALSLLEHGRTHEAAAVIEATAAPEALEGIGLLVDGVRGTVTPERIRAAAARAASLTSEHDLSLMAAAAMSAPIAGMTAGETARLAESVLDDDRLLEAENLIALHCAVWALEFAGHLDRADAWLLRMQDEIRRRAARGAFALAASARAAVAVRRGALVEAEQDATAAVDLAAAVARPFGLAISVAALVSALAGQGRLAEAERAALAFDEEGPDYDLCVLFFARAGLRLAQGQPDAAQVEVRRMLDVLPSEPFAHPGFWPWRLLAARAASATGDASRARRLVGEEHDRAVAFGCPISIGRALREQAALESGRARTLLLSQAVDALSGTDARLERALAELQYGTHLHEARGDAVAARPRLLEALDLATWCGATPVADAARTAAVAAGARPRRDRLRGVAALTAGEARVARLAAAGRTNREIAEALFVTLKTVEKHLANTYGKLGIRSRAELPEALAD